jgi:hypothetical protein
VHALRGVQDICVPFAYHYLATQADLRKQFLDATMNFRGVTAQKSSGTFLVHGGWSKCRSHGLDSCCNVLCKRSAFR